MLENFQNYDLLNVASSYDTATGFSSPPIVEDIAIELYDPVGSFTSDALPPLSAYNAANFEYADFEVGTSNALVAGSVTSLSAELVNPVPEASTTVSFSLLLVLGLGGTVIAARRRRAAASP